MWKNLKLPNLDPVIYQNGQILYNWLGYCLAYVQTAFGTGWSGPAAWDSWLGNTTQGPKHKNRNMPSGVYVPIWFDGWWNGHRYGHVAIWKDGVIYSSPFSNKYTFDKLGSIADVERIYGMTFVGWSEFVGPTRVLQYEEVKKPFVLKKVNAPQGLYARALPLSGGRIVETWDHNADVQVDGFIRGDTVNGTNIWFKTYPSGYFSISTGFTNTSLDGLNDLGTYVWVEPTTPAPTTPTPEPAKPYTFTKDIKAVTQVLPVALSNFEYDRFPSSPAGIVLHDFGEAGVNTFQSVKNTFTKDGTEVSAHLVISLENVLQMVALKDRAYHAKAVGNELIGIEIDPAYKDDPRQIATVNKVIRQLQEKFKKTLVLHKHPEFVATSCGDDVDLTKYVVPYPFVEPTEPTPEEPIEEQPPVVIPEPEPTKPIEEEKPVAIVKLTEEEQKALREESFRIQQLGMDIADTDIAKEIQSGISKRTKTIVYFTGDALIAIGGLIPLATVAFAWSMPVEQVTALASLFAGAGLAILTAFGIYKSGQKK